MAASDEDALVCDFAQVYGILTPWRELPLRLAATLAAGLDEDSRSRRQLSGNLPPTQNVLLASIADGINTMLWAQYDGSADNRPVSILDTLTAGSDLGESDTDDGFGYEDEADLLKALYPDTPSHSAFGEVS